MTAAPVVFVVGLAATYAWHRLGRGIHQRTPWGHGYVMGLIAMAAFSGRWVFLAVVAVIATLTVRDDRRARRRVNRA